MTFKWKRLTALGTAGTNSSDTTETQVASGVAVPTWAKSVVQARFCVDTLTMTTAENVSGYFRLYNDNNSIDPLNFPLPVIPANLAGAAAGQMNFPITVPVFQNVESNDVIRVAAAFDIATTGVHIFDAHLLFSDEPAPYRLHAQKMAATAMSDGLTESAAVDILTLTGKTKDLLGIWGYAVSTGTVVAAEGIAPTLKVISDLKDFQQQEMPLNIENASLGIDSYIITQPVVYLAREVGLQDLFDGFHKYMLCNRAVPVGGKQTFTMSAYHNRDVGDTIDAYFRAGLIWRE